MPNHFTWVPWFKELAAKIRHGGLDYFAERVERVDWQGAITESGGDNVDPLSFFYLLAQRNARGQFRTVYRSVHENFGVGAALPTPTDGNMLILPKPRLDLGLIHGEEVPPSELLWQMFKDATQAPSPNNRGADDRCRQLIELRDVGISTLTQVFYLINPDFYFPIDRNVRAALKDEIPSAQQDREARIKRGGLSEYLRIIHEIQNMFAECTPYEINTFLYMLKRPESNGLARDNQKYFQVSTNVINDKEDYWNVTDDERGAFSTCCCVYTGGPGKGVTYPITDPVPGDIVLVRYGQQGRAIGVVEKNEYADRNGFAEDAVIHVFWINKTPAALDGLPRIGFSNAGESTVNAFRTVESYRASLDLLNRLSTRPNVASSSSTEPPPGDSPESRVDAIPPVYDAAGRPLNTILYGPPGTGKTYTSGY